MDGGRTTQTRLFPTGRGQSDTHATILHDGKPNRTPQAGMPYETIDYVGVVRLVTHPQAGVPKDRARWFIPSSYAEHDARTHEVQRKHGVFFWLAVDVDRGDPALADVLAALQTVVSDVSLVIYSTRSARADDRRWRALVPLAEPLPGADYADTAKAFFDLLAERGIETDRSLARVGQLIYLPNRGEHYEHRVVKGARLALTTDHPIIQRREATRAADATAREAARAEALARAERRRRANGGDTSASIIAEFNARHSVADLLARYGYEHGGGDDWRSPFQASGSYATRDFGDHWVSLSGSDAAEGLGAASASGHRFGDTFDLFLKFDHAGDFSAAVRAFASELEPGRQRAKPNGPGADGPKPGRDGADGAGPDAERGGQGAAEETADPLDDLVEKSAEDPGAAFTPEVLERLATLKKEDRAAFEALRARLKKAGCRVTALDEAMAEESGDGGRGPTQADTLIDLAGAAELFHSSDGTAFADVMINEHRETWPVRTKGFRRWLARQFFEQSGGAPSSEALQSALNVIEAKAHFDGPERPVFIRVGGLDGRLYLDLADEAWRAVEIDAAGWRVIDNPPVRFRRAAGMRPLAFPMPGGSVGTLRAFLNVQSDEDFVLVVAWALAVLRNCGPYPALVLSGEQGSAKSTFSKILRALLDPNTAPLRALPREDRDLFIAASNGHVLAFDNVSGLPAWISDTLCRLATGGGFAVRQLYTDQDEVLFDAARPVILNGIEDIVTRPDLADRAVFLTLEPIAEERRRPEAELWAAFEAERARILGVLLDAVVEGLKRLPDTHLPKLPRMADFALWASACETALWPAGTFWSAYCGNRDEAVEAVIDADPVAAAVRAVMTERTVWTGTASDLLGALGEAAGERIAKSKTWPDSPRALSGRLRRAAAFLRKIGIEVAFDREGRARTRVIHITTASTDPAPESRGAQPSAPSASSAPRPKSSPNNGFAAPDPRTVADDADGRAGEPIGTVRTNPLKSNGRTDADGADANCAAQSEPEKRGPSQDDGADTCASCGEPGADSSGTDGTRNARLHRGCFDAWFAAAPGDDRIGDVTADFEAQDDPPDPEVWR